MGTSKQSLSIAVVKAASTWGCVRMRAVLGCREALAATVGLRQALFAEACGTKIQEGPARLVLLWSQSSRCWSDCIRRTTRRTLKRCSALHRECCPASHGRTPRAISPQTGTVCRVPIAGKVPSTTGSRTFQPLTEPSSHKHLPCCMTCSLLYRARSPRRDEELRGTTANDRDPARSSNSGSRSPSVSLPLNLFPFNGRSRALPRNERCTQFGRATWRGAMMGEGIYHTRKPRATHYSTLYECRVAYRFQSRLSIGPGPDNCPGDC